MKILLGLATIAAGVLLFAFGVHSPLLLASKWLCVAVLGLSALLLRLGVGILFGFSPTDWEAGE